MKGKPLLKIKWDNIKGVIYQQVIRIMNLYDLITASKCKKLKLKLKMTRNIQENETAFHEFRETMQWESKNM